LLFVRVLITEEVRPNRLPVDGGRGISSVFRPSSLDYGALGIGKRKDAGFAPEGIPDLLDELETLADRQPGNVDGWIYHRLESARDPGRRQLSDL
jgi:hypothetical protein